MSRLQAILLCTSKGWCICLNMKTLALSNMGDLVNELSPHVCAVTSPCSLFSSPLATMISWLWVAMTLSGSLCSKACLILLLSWALSELTAPLDALGERQLKRPCPCSGVNNPVILAPPETSSLVLLIFFMNPFSMVNAWQLRISSNQHGWGWRRSVSFCPLFSCVCLLCSVAWGSVSFWLSGEMWWRVTATSFGNHNLSVPQEICQEQQILPSGCVGHGSLAESVGNDRPKVAANPMQSRWGNKFLLKSEPVRSETVHDCREVEICCFQQTMSDSFHKSVTTILRCGHCPCQPSLASRSTMAPHFMQHENMHNMQNIQTRTLPPTHKLTHCFQSPTMSIPIKNHHDFTTRTSHHGAKVSLSFFPKTNKTTTQNSQSKSHKKNLATTALSLFLLSSFKFLHHQQCQFPTFPSNPSSNNKPWSVTPLTMLLPSSPMHSINTLCLETKPPSTIHAKTHWIKLN